MSEDKKNKPVTQADFTLFRAEIKEQMQYMTHSLFIKLSSVTVGSVAISFFAFAWIFDYRLDFTNAQNEARFARVEAVAFTPSNEAVLNEIRELKAHYSGFYNKTHKLKKSRKAKPHK